ncbi:MAG: YeeE/YedE family protein [Xanthomonadales bacterium]|nr:YeeE/YedE family protein [Xanthomonadales bacterium]MDH4019081.1 YeeE/YedE family protein [Xanthomonadales bacterium]
MKLLLGLAIGAAIGAVMQLGGASSYRKILGSLLLKDMTIIKLILMTIAVTTVGIYALDLIDMANMDIKPTYVLGIVIAGLIFGVGFAISGYCPGTCVLASAEGKTDAMFTLLGGLIGAALYAVVYPLLAPLINISNFGQITLATVFNVNNGIWIAVPFSAILLLLVFRVLKDRYE